MIAPPRARVADEVLIAAIRSRPAGHGREVVGLRRSPSAYATSYPLEDVSVTFADGRGLALMFKDLDPSRLPDRARRAKPAFLIDPRREIAVYRTILAPREAGPAVYGDGHGDAPWLLLEKAAGAELYQVGDLDAWIEAASWLARFHDSCGPPDPACSVPLVPHTPAFHGLWLDRALQFFRHTAPPSRYRRTELEWIAARFDRVVDRLQAWPATVIHGEFYASNVLAEWRGSSWRICPVDWEMAAAGPGILDLAALTSGDWPEEARRRIVAGYVNTCAARPASLADTVEAVDYAQIYRGVQWLGWFGRRRQPAGHARDWLADAVDRARRVGL